MGSKFWFVAVNEYKRHVLKKRFIMAILSVPLVLGISFLAGYMAYLIERDMSPVGYIDQAGILADPQPVPEELMPSDAVELIAFKSESEAKAALTAEEIQAYYLIAPDYETSRSVTLIYNEEPGENAEDYFFTFLQVNISAGLPEKVATRTLDGFSLTIRDLSSGRELNTSQVINIILPIVIGLIFTFVLTTGSGYFANAVSEEKENRTIEMLTTSMSANQFILGKVLGIVMVVFTQVTSWGIFLVLALFGANVLYDFEWLDITQIDMNTLPLLLIWFTLSFFFFAGLTLTFSSLVTETQESQQMISIVAMPVGFSYWFTALIMNSPNSPLSIVLSMLPFTAPTIMPLRLAFTNIPMPQYLLGAGIQLASAIFTIWLAARAYELGMLRYGKRLHLTDLFKPQGNGK